MQPHGAAVATTASTGLCCRNENKQRVRGSEGKKEKEPCHNKRPVCVSVCVCVCVFMCVMFVSLHQSECVCADSYMHASKALQRVKEKEDKMESRMRENKRERLKNVHVCVCVCVTQHTAYLISLYFDGKYFNELQVITGN